MEFRHRKIGTAEASRVLTPLPIGEITPFALMWAPVYVFMERNQKYVALKAPLDFFDPNEIEKWKASRRALFVQKCVVAVAPFVEAGKRIRRLLTKYREEGQGLAPTSFELSDAVLRVLAPLWGPATEIEPFFAVAFAEAICGPLQSELLVEAREESVEHLECAILRSSLGVFLGVQLGMTQITHLKRLRSDLFVLSVQNLNLRVDLSPEVQELSQIVMSAVTDNSSRSVASLAMSLRNERVAKMIASRLARIERDQLKGANPASASIYARGGFLEEGAA